jgi:hypothetical protein
MSALRTFLGVSVALAMGCGGSESSTVGDGGSTGNSGSSGGGSSSGSAGSSGAGSSSGGDDSSVTSDDDSGLPPVGEDGGVAVPPDDGGTQPVGDGGRGRMTPPPVTDGGADQTVCGMTTCDSATDICCVATRMCVAANATCRGSTLACSGSNSCTAGSVCCEEATGRNTTTSKCETKCPAGAAQLCTTNADCATDYVCRAAGNYGVCVREPMVPPRPDGGVVIVRRDGGV